jgi:hypothetical protein
MIPKLLSFILILFLLSPGLVCAAEEGNITVIPTLDPLTDPAIKIDTDNETATIIPEPGVSITKSTRSGSMDEGKEMIKDAIKETPREWADAALSEKWGVKLGSLPDEVSASPSANCSGGAAPWKP